MLNKKTLETNIGKLKNRICLRQLYQIKNGPKQNIFNTFQNGPDTVHYTSFLFQKRRGGGEENIISKAADRNEI